MCGICGVVQIEGELRTVVLPEVPDLMTDSMTHRGSNDRGTYQTPGVALGVRRLSIVNVAGGHQPFSSEDAAVAAIQDGELYNQEEVRADGGCDPRDIAPARPMGRAALIAVPDLS
jgi:asparagine synthase (glutamine-hydrolysing)